MNKRIHIAIYSGTVPGTTFIERLSQGLAAKGHQIFLFGFQTGKVRKMPNGKYSTYRHWGSKLLQLLKYTVLLLLFKPKSKRKLDSLIAGSHKKPLLQKLKFYPVLYYAPEIFHLQWGKSVADWMWVQEFGIKLVVSLRGAHINYSPVVDAGLASVYKTTFPKIDGFHAVSKAIAQEAIKYGAAPGKIKVVYSGLDLKALPFHLKERQPTAPLKICSIGRAHWIKGYSYALQSVALLKASGVACRYTLVGVGQDEELLYLREQLGLVREVIFLEKQSFQEVIKLIAEADVLLLSSVEEGIANVVLEAMALGILVVSTQCGGMEEVITDNENGFLVPIRNPQAMATALKQVAELPESGYQEMTKRARVTMEAKHDIEQMIENMQALYRQVLIDRP